MYSVYVTINSVVLCVQQFPDATSAGVRAQQLATQHQQTLTVEDSSGNVVGTYTP